MKSLAVLAIACAALALGCGMADELDGTASGEATACVVLGAGAPWWNQTFPEQTTMFHAELDATPAAANSDAVIGLSDGAASAFAKLAAIVRFNAAGTIDVRAGSGYRADVAIPYYAGTTYHVRLDVDVRTHRYSVWIAVGAGSRFYTRLANNYAFRTEQAAVTRLSNVGAKVDSASGSITLCDVSVVADVTTGDGCATVAASTGFAPIQIPDATRVQVLDVSARASTTPIDAVIGMSAAPARGFSDLATAVRFAPSGALDVRDGDGYRADYAQPYGTGEWRFRVLADLISHTYSVFQVVPGDSQELAHQYRFRTQQATVGHLGYLDLVVDATPGTLQICNFRAFQPTGVAYTREGDPWVVPLAGGAALASDGATTTRLDASGRVSASYPRGGALAVDVLGDVFIAAVDGNTLAIEKLDPAFVSRWRTTQTVLAGARVVAMATDPAGTVHVGLVTPQDGSVQIVRINAGGTFLSAMYASGNAVALDTDGRSAIAWQDGDTLRISTWDANGAPIWQRAFAGQASVGAITFDPGHGVLFGGFLWGPIDFGGGTIRGVPQGSENPTQDGYWVKLGSDGGHVVSMATGYDTTHAIAATASRIVVSSTWRTQLFYPRYTIYDATGTIVGGGDGPLGEHGHGGRVALADGRLWWNFRMMIHPVDREFSYMAAIDL